MLLNPNAYTTSELIHYAGIDDRYKPMLADRIAQEGLPEDADCDCEEPEFFDETAILLRDTQRDWLKKLEEVIATLAANEDVSSSTVELLSNLYDEIETHETA